MSLAQVFGRYVRKVRLEQDLAQEQLAFEAELQRSYVSELEAGKRNPTLDVVDAIARGLKVAAYTLLMED